MNRRQVLTLCLVIVLGGCSNWNVLTRSQSPDEEGLERKTRLVGDLAVPFGLHPVRIEAVGLVTGLNGTGSDPKPSPQRSALLAEMESRGVTLPKAVMASRDTAMVLIRGWLKPGVQKGDRFDIEVRIPSRSDTTSLRDGYMLETRLKETAVLGGQYREGHMLALAKGPILVDPSASTKEDPVLLGRGKILGGGVCLKSRPLGLVLKPEHKNVLHSARIEDAINKRFFVTRRGVKVGMATAKTDEFVELAVHPRYADNIGRYLDVVRSIPLRETEVERIERMELIEKQLNEPVTAATAARQLEALGKLGIDVLLRGAKSPDPEVRFHSAEALAYLDRREAAEPLGEIAEQHPAFRAYALAALGAMDDVAAYDELRRLLSVNSAETRYGAFRALWTMNPGDPLVLGEELGDDGFSYHVLNTEGPPMVHVCTHKRAELVFFGADHRLRGPVFLEAGGNIVVRSSRDKPDEVVVSRFAVGEPDQQRVVSNRLDAVVRAIVELGGTYPDTVQALTQAKAAGALTARFEVDALPEIGRIYDRGGEEDEEADDHVVEEEKRGWLGRSPLARIFPRIGGGQSTEESGHEGEAHR